VHPHKSTMQPAATSSALFPIFIMIDFLL